MTMLCFAKGADDAGSGVAHSNVGLCHGLMGDYQRAAKHHQEALRVALRVQVNNSPYLAIALLLAVQVLF